MKLGYTGGKYIFFFLGYTVCKGNKCHPFNSRRGRLKGPIYTIWGLNFIIFSEKGVSFSLSFTLYSVYR